MYLCFFANKVPYHAKLMAYYALNSLPKNVSFEFFCEKITDTLAVIQQITAK